MFIHNIVKYIYYIYTAAHALLGRIWLGYVYSAGWPSSVPFRLWPTVNKFYFYSFNYFIFPSISVYAHTWSYRRVNYTIGGSNHGQITPFRWRTLDAVYETGLFTESPWNKRTKFHLLCLNPHYVIPTFYKIWLRNLHICISVFIFLML